MADPTKCVSRSGCMDVSQCLKAGHCLRPLIPLASNLESIPEVTLDAEQVELAYQLKAKWERSNSQWLIPISLTRYIVHLHDTVADKEADCIRLHKQFMDAKYGPEHSETTAVLVPHDYTCTECFTDAGQLHRPGCRFIEIDARRAEKTNGDVP